MLNIQERLILEITDKIGMQGVKKRLRNLESRMPDQPKTLYYFAEAFSKTLKGKKTPKEFMAEMMNFLGKIRENQFGPQDDQFFAYTFTRLEVYCAMVGGNIPEIVRHVSPQDYATAANEHYTPNTKDWVITGFMARRD